MGANDISRWCTVWSLLERGTYVIDECPWQADTQDKVFRAPKGAIAPPAGKEPVRHYYSSKPALLPTLIAGILYPARLATGVPLDRVVLRQRAASVDPESRTRRRRMASKECSRHPKTPCAGRFISFISSRSWCYSMSFRLEYFWFSTLGCSTATRPTSGPGFSAWSPRRSGRISCRLRRR